MERRAFLKLLGVGAAAGSFPGLALSAVPAKGRVIIIGGGYAGATAAKYLRRWGGPQLEIILIEKNTTFVSCPLSNLVLGGSKQIGDLTFNFSGLDRYDIKRLHEEVTGVDGARRKITMASGDDLDYDRLIIAPDGSRLYTLTAHKEGPKMPPQSPR